MGQADRKDGTRLLFCAKDASGQDWTLLLVCVVYCYFHSTTFRKSKYVILMLCVVWLASAAISCPICHWSLCRHLLRTSKQFRVPSVPSCFRVTLQWRLLALASFLEHFERATAYSIRPIYLACYATARPSVCPSHWWIIQKRLKIGSWNFHHTVDPSL